jgi:multidrug efflux system membrane fusion protein
MKQAATSVSGGKKIMLSLVFLAVFTAAAAAFFYWVKPAGKNAQAQKPRQYGAPVLVAAAAREDFKVYLSALGTVTPILTVTIKPRVEGHLINMPFKEGQLVEKGDLLAEIDPRPYYVQLHHAEGQLARDEELLRNAKVDLERYRQLWKQDSIPKQQLDTQEAIVRQYEGTVRVDKAAIESAKLQIHYCRITAPFSGRVGLRQVDPGSYVRTGDPGGLVIVTKMEPITVVFPIPEDSLPPVLAKLRKGERLLVHAFNREMKERIATGVLLTHDNQIDTATGTVRMKAVFENKKGELFPNQFVNVLLLTDIRKKATVVPVSAIQRGPKGAFVYVVKPDSKVTIRAVRIGEIQTGRASVLEGLASGEIVVTDGAERLREGTKVEVKKAPPAEKKKKQAK